MRVQRHLSEGWFLLIPNVVVERPVPYGRPSEILSDGDGRLVHHSPTAPIAFYSTLGVLGKVLEVVQPFRQPKVVAKVVVLHPVPRILSWACMVYSHVRPHWWDPRSAKPTCQWWWHSGRLPHRNWNIHGWGSPKPHRTYSLFYWIPFGRWIRVQWRHRDWKTWQVWERWHHLCRDRLPPRKCLLLQEGYKSMLVSSTRRISLEPSALCCFHGQPATQGPHPYHGIWNIVDTS